MSRSILQLFSARLSRLRIPKELPVAVAISGGCDSMALTLLATRVFDRVVGLTVDHKLREDSTDEAQRVHQLVTDLGAEAHTLTLDWGKEGNPPSGKLQVLAREKRYSALLQRCREFDVRTLLVGHHLDDQSENFLYRLTMGSGIDGLGGMHPVSTWPGYSEIKIFRPLLSLHKHDLVEVCRREGVEWVEDPTNKTTKYLRNHYRKVLEENPQLVDGVEQLVRSCDQARTTVSKQVHDQVMSLSSINTRYGYLSVDLKKLLLLPSPVAKRVLSCLIRYTSGSDQPISYKITERVHKNLKTYNGKNTSAGKTVITPLPNGAIAICRAYPQQYRKPCPIRLDETLLWEDRWEITLRQKDGKTRSRNSKGAKEQDTVYSVRNMSEKDWCFAVRGVRAIRNAALPPPLVRPSLPVIVDGSGNVILIPHFKFAERMVNIIATAAFKPKLTLEEVAGTHQWITAP